MKAIEFYNAHATNIVNVPRVGHPEDPSEMTELETLKAQLAKLDADASDAFRRHLLTVAVLERDLRASEAQVRELRELLTRLLAECRRLQTNTFDKALPDFALSSQVEAALRSAPPSEWDKSSQALRDSTKHVHDENETNAGEERQDLAQVPAAHHTRWEGENPHNATVGSRSPRSAESASTQSGPQDSPSRSEWKFVGDDELTNHFRRTHCLSDLTPEAWQTVANCLLRNFRVIKAAPPSPACNSMQDNKLATDLKSEPICPAREKEKAE